MAKYLRPRRGTFMNAYNNNIVLKKGEMFLAVNDGSGNTIGRGPGYLYLGDGVTDFQNYNYNTTATNVPQPILVHPHIYSPSFANSNPSTASWTFDAATSIINSMGDGATPPRVSLPQIIGKIKAALCKHADSLNYLNTEVVKAKGVELTQAQYNALSTAEKNNGTEYYITDGDNVQDNLIWTELDSMKYASNIETGSINLAFMTNPGFYSIGNNVIVTDTPPYTTTEGSALMLRVIRNEEDSTDDADDIICTQIAYYSSEIFVRHLRGSISNAWGNWITYKDKSFLDDTYLKVSWFNNHIKFGTRVTTVNANNGCVIFTANELKTLFNTTDTLSNANTVVFATNGDLVAQGHYMSACGWRSDSSGGYWIVQEVNNNNFIAGNIRLNYLAIRF